MKNKDYNKLRHSGYGKGGYKCRCCGPKRGDRSAYNRRTRKRLKEYSRKYEE